MVNNTEYPTLRKRATMRLRRWEAKYGAAFRAWILPPTLVFLLLLLFYLFVSAEHQTLARDWSLFRWLSRCFRPSRISTLHYMNIITIIGLIVTAWGVVLGWHQLKLANDRIVGYTALYRWVRKLLKEINRQEADSFLFYGSTILPGNISFTDSRAIQQYEMELTALLDGRQDHPLRECRLIVPRDEDYDQTYKFFTRRFVSTADPDLNDPQRWEEEVKRKKEEARDFQDKLQRYDSRRTEFPAKILTPSRTRLIDIQRAYFFSNGHRIIYAIPLHYVHTTATGSRNSLAHITPQLVGFTTTDHSVVKAFEQQFRDIRDRIDQNGLLLSMYSKHLICPSYLRTALECMGKRSEEPLSEQEIANIDHDHFGGSNSTAECIEKTSIIDSSIVLDIGSGFGGPARLIAERTGCHVVGIELQEDRYALAVELTRRTGLNDRVSFYKYDAVRIGRQDIQAPPGIEDLRFTHIIAFLSILHFTEKPRFLRSIFRYLQRGGYVFFEDYCQGRDVSDTEMEDLLEVVSCPGLLPQSEYEAHLREGGLTNIEVVDKTDEWLQLAKERVAKLESRLIHIGASDNGSDFLDKIDQDRVRMALEFSRGVVRLYERGIVKGIQLVGQKYR